MNVYFVVSILHNKEVVDYTWDDVESDDVPVYEDQPFYAVEAFVNGKSRTISYLPTRCETDEVEYKICNSVHEVEHYLDEDEIMHLRGVVLDMLGIY